MAVQTVTWNPLVEQVAELDTLYLQDMTVEQTLQPGLGGFLTQRAITGTVPPWVNPVGSPVAVVPGKFRDAVKPTGGTPDYVFKPLPGLLSTEEFTLEFWVALDIDWATATGVNGRMLGAAMANQEAITVVCSSGTLSIVYGHQQGTAREDRTLTYPGASSVVAGQMVSVALTLTKTGLLTMYVDGVQRDQETGVTGPVVWSGGWRSGGLTLGGYSEQANPHVAISDLRISRQARVPGVALQVTDANVLTVTDTPTGDTINEMISGALHGFRNGDSGGPDDTVAAVAAGSIPVLRTDKMLTCSPIKAGGVDGTHPTLGQSGAYSYDWQVVDRTIAKYAAWGVQELFLTMDSCPSILGGPVAPYSGAQLTSTGYAWQSSNPSTHPNDNAAFAAMCADLVHHILVDLDFPIAYAGLWNEPDGSAFWSGADRTVARAQYLDLYAAVMPAVRAVAPSVKLGGPEIADPITNLVWATDLIARCAANNLPLDFLSFHNYSGNLGVAYRTVAMLKRDLAVAGLTGVEFIDGESNAITSVCFPGSTSTPWGALSERYVINDWAAAWVAQSFMAYQDLGVVRSIFVEPSTELDRVGYYSSGLFGAAGPWAPGNTVRLWELLAPALVETTLDADPRLKAQASIDEDGRVTVLAASASYHPGDPRTLAIEVPESIPDGSPVVAYLIDDEHSNRHQAGGTGALETIAVDPVTDGKVYIDLKDRSVALLEITPVTAAPTISRLTKLNGAPVLLP